MLFKWQGILQFISQSGFSFDSVFFLLLFTAVLKTSADTNVRLSDALTNCIKDLYCYNLKSLIFKDSPVFIPMSKSTTQFLKTFFCMLVALKSSISAFNSSISSKRVFIAVSDFGAQKKKEKMKFATSN